MIGFAPDAYTYRGLDSTPAASVAPGGTFLIALGPCFVRVERRGVKVGEESNVRSLNPKKDRKIVWLKLLDIINAVRRLLSCSCLTP